MKFTASNSNFATLWSPYDFGVLGGCCGFVFGLGFFFLRREVVWFFCWFVSGVCIAFLLFWVLFFFPAHELTFSSLFHRFSFCSVSRI